MIEMTVELPADLSKTVEVGPSGQLLDKSKVRLGNVKVRNFWYRCITFAVLIQIKRDDPDCVVKNSARSPSQMR